MNPAKMIAATRNAASLVLYSRVATSDVIAGSWAICVRFDIAEIKTVITSLFYYVTDLNTFKSKVFVGTKCTDCAV